MSLRGRRHRPRQAPMPNATPSTGKPRCDRDVRRACSEGRRPRERRPHLQGRRTPPGRRFRPAILRRIDPFLEAPHEAEQMHPRPSRLSSPPAARRYARRSRRPREEPPATHPAADSPKRPRSRQAGRRQARPVPRRTPPGRRTAGSCVLRSLKEIGIEWAARPFMPTDQRPRRPAAVQDLQLLQRASLQRLRFDFPPSVR